MPLAPRGRRFGVEIEFECGDSPYEQSLDSAVIASALYDAGIDCYDGGYTHTVMDEWKIVPDSSVVTGWELVSPPLTWDQRDQITVVCEVLADLGARATSRCGLHVHHEVRDLSLAQIKQLYRYWHDLQPLTDRFVAEWRRDGDWCEHLTSLDLQVMEQQVQRIGHLVYFDRYKALNVTCFASYGTVEVRQHEGTLDAAEILAWVAYGQALITAALEDDAVPFPDDAETLLDTLPMTCEHSRTYLKRKARGERPAYAFN